MGILPRKRELGLGWKRVSWVVAVLAAAACSDGADEGQAAGSAEPTGSTEPTTRVTLGSAGGTVVVNDGPRVTIPRGALSSSTELSLTKVESGALAAEVADGVVLAGEPFAYTPHGVTFDAPVTIEVPHDGTATAILRLADEDAQQWELQPEVTIAATLATFQTSHFSVYVPVHAPQDVLDHLPLVGAAMGGGRDGRWQARRRRQRGCRRGD